jgi:hypothetical protein
VGGRTRGLVSYASTAKGIVTNPTCPFCSGVFSARSAQNSPSVIGVRFDSHSELVLNVVVRFASSSLSQNNLLHRFLDAGGAFSLTRRRRREDGCSVSVSVSSVSSSSWSLRFGEQACPHFVESERLQRHRHSRLHTYIHTRRCRRRNSQKIPLLGR